MMFLVCYEQYNTPPLNDVDKDILSHLSHHVQYLIITLFFFDVLKNLAKKLLLKCASI